MSEIDKILCKNYAIRNDLEKCLVQFWDIADGYEWLVELGAKCYAKLQDDNNALVAELKMMYEKYEPVCWEERGETSPALINHESIGDAK